MVTATSAPPLANRMVLAGLHSPLHRLLDSGTTALRYISSRGLEVTLPVGYARAGGSLVVFVGNADTKTWWRHFRTRQQVDVLWHGGWRSTTAVALPPGTPQHDAAAAEYAARHPRVRTSADPVVLVALPDDATDQPEPKPGRGLWRAWTGWATAGELIGFTVPAVTAAVIGDVAGFPPAAMVVLAGAVEGSVLGAAQAHVLRRALPALDGRRWILATAAAAAVAWTIGLVPMLTNGFEGMSPAVWVPLAAALGTVLLATIGTAQWLVLRRHVERSALWILTTAGAWAAGLLVFNVVATPLWQPGQSAALLAAIGVFAGLLMAFTVAALTGLALVNLLRGRDRSVRPAPARPTR